MGVVLLLQVILVLMLQNTKVRCVNFNESDLLTCFSNDFGYEKWVEKTIEFTQILKMF